MTSDVAPRSLWCLIKGDSTPFQVTAPVNASINRLLMHLVHDEGIREGTILANDIVLWKVRIL